SRRPWRRWAAGAWLVAFAAIGFMSESRTLIASLFVSFAGFLIVLGILRGKLHLKSVITIILLRLVVSAARLEVISGLRLPGAQPNDRSAALEMMMSDPRPAIWAAYLDLAGNHPWFGVGLGRTVPPRAYRLQDDQVLRNIDVHASTHAHNVLLDLVLQ